MSTAWLSSIQLQAKQSGAAKHLSGIMAFGPRLNYRLWRFLPITVVPGSTMPERTDDQLMLDYAAGNLAAFELLYSRHRGALYRFILRQVNDAVTANDLYQGCWEKIIKSRSRFQKGVPFQAWMFRIARNHVIDHFRRTRPESSDDIDQLTETGGGPEETLGEHQQAEHLAGAIAQLPEDQRETLLLRLESELDLQTIANITGVKPETAKSRLRYATAKLQGLLNPAAGQVGGGHG